MSNFQWMFGLISLAVHLLALTYTYCLERKEKVAFMSLCKWAG